MKKILVIFYFLWMLFQLSEFSFAQDGVILETIVVTPTRLNQEIGDVLRDVYVINAKEINSLSANSIGEVLSYIGGVDIQQRGPYGVQSDVTIRGSTFSQVLVLVDGVRVNDPQTAHHNLDLGLPLESVERIEVLRGCGSSLYGTDGFGGVINIITKDPKADKNHANISIGSHQSFKYCLGLSDKGDKAGSSFFFERKKSNGYRYDTDFDIYNISSKTIFNLTDTSEIDLLISYMDKEFGANDFYGVSPSYEWTETLFVNLGGKFGDEVKIKPKLFYRRHKDKYVWTIKNPGISTNHHTTDVFGANIESIFPLKWTDIVLGVEGASEAIDSSNVGDHHIGRGAVYLEGVSRVDKFIANLGMRLDYYSNFKWEYSPTISLGYKFSPLLKLYSSIGKAFRVPSFTDRYYVSRTNIGNSELNPEEAWCYELGADYTSSNRKINIKASLFFRDEDDVIDWIAPDTGNAGTEANPWQAENVGEVEIKGGEITIGFNPFESIKLDFDYTIMDSDSELPQGYVSKYALRHPEHQINVGLRCKLPLDITGSLRGKYVRRVQESGYRLFDIKASKKIKNTELFIEATNIFGEDYQEITGVPMPGRWISCGVKTAF